MDTRNQIPIVVLLLVYTNRVSAGLDVPKPDNLQVKILDGEVIAHWEPPADAPFNSEYNVQMARYIDHWAEVETCTRINRTYCDLSLLLHDYHTKYKVQVQLVAGGDASSWTSKLFTLSQTELQPPSFTLMATSSTLSISVHDKPLLKEIFPFGVQYTIFLEEMGQDNKTTTTHLNDDKDNAQRAHTFKHLHWGKEYCVSIKVQGEGGVLSSPMSPRQCLLLPEQEWYITAISSLSVLSVLAAIIMTIGMFLCYLKRPEKTPAVLKTPASGWLPFSAGRDTMEVVTDKGWFLSRHRADVRGGVADLVAATEDDAEEERRTSTDSGISIEADSAKADRGAPATKQEDSGCGSLGGLQSSAGSQLDSSSVTLDSELQKECTRGGSYRSQSPSALHAEDDFRQTPPHAGLADVVTGYRAGPQSCICSGAGQCTWCHKQGLYASQVIKQYSHFVNSYKVGLPFPSYRKSQMDTVVVDDLDKTFMQLGEKFPLLTALSPGGHPDDRGQDFNMNDVPLSLSDVQLTID